MRILVTGTEGYLGSLLAPELTRQGYEVIGLDTGFYKERTFCRDARTTPLTVAKDLRHVGRRSRSTPQFFWTNEDRRSN